MCKNNCDCKKCFKDNICDECKVRTTTNCITVNNELPNIGSDAGEVLTTVLEMIDDQLGNPPVVPAVYIENIGTGSQLYKGMSNLGYQQFRTLLSGSDELTIVQGANEVTFSIDLPTPPVIPTYSASNAGNLGFGTYKNSTVVGNNTQFNFKNVVTANTGTTGTELLNAVTDTSDNITISAKKIASDSLIITESAGIINIEAPTIVDIPRFIVNSASQASIEDGTLSKPFKTIQGALNAFVGTGTAVSPQFSGAEVVIQKGLGYTFTGNFNYNALTVILEEGTQIVSSPSVGNYLCDLDSLADVKITISFILKESSSLILTKSGFRNAGTSANTSSFQNYKAIRIAGAGTIFQTEGSTSDLYTVLESNFTVNNTFNNDSFEQFQINGITIQTISQSIYKKGGNSRFIINDIDTVLAGNSTLPTSTKFFNQIGGSVRWTGGSIGSVVNFNIFIDSLFPLTRNTGLVCDLFLSNIILSGKMTTLFENIGTLQSNVEAKSILTEFFLCTNITKSSSIMWTGCGLFSNIFLSGKPDLTQTDLTKNNSISCYNIFASNVTEILRSFSTRAAAVAGGLKKGEKFINTAGVPSPTTGWIIDMVME